MSCLLISEPFGWGMFIPLWVNVTVMPKEPCIHDYDRVPDDDPDKAYYHPRDDSVMCAGTTPGGKDACLVYSYLLNFRLFYLFCSGSPLCRRKTVEVITLPRMSLTLYLVSRYDFRFINIKHLMTLLMFAIVSVI